MVLSTRIFVANTTIISVLRNLAISLNEKCDRSHNATLFGSTNESKSTLVASDLNPCRHDQWAIVCYVVDK